MIELIKLTNDAKILAEVARGVDPTKLKVNRHMMTAAGIDAIEFLERGLLKKNMVKKETKQT